MVPIGVSLIGLEGEYAVYTTQKGNRVDIEIDKGIQSKGGNQSTKMHASIIICIFFSTRIRCE